MILKPYSFDSTIINKSVGLSTDYDAYFPREDPLLQQTGNPYYIKRAGAASVLSGKDFIPVSLTVCVGLQHDFTSLYETLNQVFDVSDETPRQFVCIDTEDSDKQYYVYATTKEVERDPAGGPKAFVTLSLDGPIWHSSTENSQTFSVTDSTGSTSVTNNGNTYAYPTFEITPTSQPSTDFIYNTYLQIVPTSSIPWPNRFLDITGSSDTTFDTAALITAGKMTTDGDDLRVFRDGVEVDYWLDQFNTTDTHVIVTCDMPPRFWMGLKTAIGATDTVTELVINDTLNNRNAVTAMPNSGRVIVYTGTNPSSTDAEEFSYTAKTITATKLAFTIDSRALRGTVALDHAAASTVQHLPYDFTIVYGNASATARTMDDTKKPIQSLTSRNNSFVYNTAFSEIDGIRPNIWVPVKQYVSNATLSRSVTYTSTNDAGDTDPATALGIKSLTYQNLGVWNPDSVSLGWRGDFHDYVSSVSASGVQSQSVATIPATVLEAYTEAGGWVQLWALSAQSATDFGTFTAWSKASSDATIPANTEFLRFRQGGTILGSTDYYNKTEINAITVGLTQYPHVAIRAEAANVNVNCTISNDTTGESFQIVFPAQEDETITINTDPDFPTATYQGRVVNGAISLSSTRAAWLKLEPGANTISFTNNLSVANDISIVLKWRDRVAFF